MAPATAGPPVCVIGGGLAGLAAAVTLADAGVGVRLLEARPRLGGATFSFDRSVDGTSLTVDNGQHIVLRCCTAYLGFLERLGVADLVPVQDRLSVPVVTAGGVVSRLRRTGLPAPLHLAGSVARYPLLSPMDKVKAVRALLALRRLDPDDPALDRESFGAWLRRYGQSRRAVDGLWGLIGVPTLNARPDEASLALAAMVFRTGLLDHNDAADIGIPTVPFSRLHAEPAAAALAAAGASVRTGVKVTGLGAAAGVVRVSTRAGDVPAAAAILAVPPAEAAALLPDHPGVAGFTALGASPIVSLHVVYDRPVTRLPFAVGHGSPVQWVFDRTAASGLTDGQYLTVALSAAEEYLGQPVARLRETFLPALAELFPSARTAGVRHFLVTREAEATFHPAPGQAARRPDSVTHRPGVFLAGSWTDTGWPATMESAVRSGIRAARHALAHVGPAEGAAAATPMPEGAPL